MIVLPHPAWKRRRGQPRHRRAALDRRTAARQPRDPHARRALSRDGRPGRALLRDARASRDARPLELRPPELRKDGAVAIASINPATGETLRTFDAAFATPRSSGAWRSPPASSRAGGRRPFAERARVLLRAPPTCSRRRKQELGQDHDARDGQADRGRRSPRPRSAPGSAASTPSTREAFPRRRARSRPTPRASFVRYEPARARARRHAVELPVLAGLPLRRAGADGGQRRSPEARLERAAVRAGDRGDLPGRRGSRGRVPDAAHRLRARRGADRGPAHRGGHADRQRGRRASASAARPARRSRRPSSSSAAAIPSS